MTVNLAIIGIGRIGKIHANSIFTHPNAKLVGFFDENFLKFSKGSLFFLDSIYASFFQIPDFLSKEQPDKKIIIRIANHPYTSLKYFNSKISFLIKIFITINTVTIHITINGIAILPKSKNSNGFN